MKKILTLCGVLLALSTSAAFAAGLDLTWKDCVLETSQQDINFTNCTTSGVATTTLRLYSVLKVPVPLPNFIAVQNTYDLQEQGAATLSGYWRFDASCNQSGLTIQDDPDPAGAGICAGETSPWGVGGGDGTENIIAYGSNFPTPGRGRLITAGNLDASTPFPLDIGINYYINTLLFNTSQRATCPGCNNQVILVWNDAECAQNTGERTHISGPDKLGPCVQFNHAPVGNCAATPTKKTTWGQLKSIYR